MAWKKRADETCGTSRMTSSPCAFFLDSASPLSWFFFLKATVSRATKPAQEGNTYNRASRWPMMRFTWANLRVFLAMPIASKRRRASLGGAVALGCFGRGQRISKFPRGLRLTVCVRRGFACMERQCYATRNTSWRATAGQPHPHPFCRRCGTHSLNHIDIHYSTGAPLRTARPRVYLSLARIHFVGGGRPRTSKQADTTA